MSALLDGAKRRLGRGGDVPSRIDGLRSAVEAARGRLDDGLVDDAAAVAERATARLGLSGDHTVVALAGATGSGKSSTFNALTGLELAAVGVRRPTTSTTMACAWGADGAGELMDWVGVPQRHQVSRGSQLDGGKADRELEGLVLLDLPDHDSTEVAHHLEVDRLVRLADLIVWVLDPQKYADAALHERYLAPLASHQEIMLVALNHIDEVAAVHRGPMVADLRRLLVADGLPDVPVIACSAQHGDGIVDLRRAVAERVAAKKTASRRLMADVRSSAERLSQVNGEAKPGSLDKDRRDELVGALADAAGVPTVVRAVRTSTQRRAAAATGWPLTSWLAKLKPDPLRRLHLDLGSSGKELTGRARTSIPESTPVQRARVDTAVRAVCDQVAGHLATPWATSVRRASVSRSQDLNDALDKAVAGVDLGVSGTPLWWRLVQVVQWLVMLAALTGLVWLGVLAVLGYLQLPAAEPPRHSGLPLPTGLLLGGVATGILLGLVCRVLVGWSARAKARSVDRRLRAAIAEVTDDLVVAPIEEELLAYRRVREGLATAGG